MESSNYTTVFHNESYNNSSLIDLGGYSDFEVKLFYYLWTYVIPIVYSIIILLGTVGNSMVIYVILCRPKMRTTINFLLFNLAVADIAFLVTCVTFQAHKYAASNWTFSDAVCKLAQYSLYVTSYVTVYSLLAVAMLRYLTVVWSTATVHLRTKRNVIIVCVCIWIAVLLVNIPTLLRHRVNVMFGYVYCGVDAEHVPAVFITFFIFAYLLPLGGIFIIYVLLIRYLRKKQRSSSVRSESSAAKTTRASRTVAIVIGAFALLWFPSHAQNLVFFIFGVPQSTTFEIFRCIFHAMSYANSVVNPIIYNFASDDFRCAFKQVLTCRCCCAPPSPTAVSVGTAHFRSSYSHRVTDACDCAMLNGEDDVTVEVVTGTPECDENEAKV